MQLYLPCHRDGESEQGWESLREMAAVATVNWWDPLKWAAMSLIQPIVAQWECVPKWAGHLILNLNWNCGFLGEIIQI